MPSWPELDHALSGLIVEGGPLKVEAGALKRHQDTYFDTIDDALALRGFALRRRAGATSAVICLKSDAAVGAEASRGGSRSEEGAHFERFELEVAHDGPSPPWPRAIEDALEGRVPDGTLAAARPRIVLDVVRVSHGLVHVGAADDDFRIELVFDEVVCRLPTTEGSPDHSGEGTVARFHEVELEAGPRTGARALQTVADALSTLLPLTAASVSKAERARALLAPFAAT